MTTLHHAAAQLVHQIATSGIADWTVSRDCFIDLSRRAYLLPEGLAARWWQALENIGAITGDALDFDQDNITLHLIVAAEQAQPTSPIVNQILRLTFAACGKPS